MYVCYQQGIVQPCLSPDRSPGLPRCAGLVSGDHQPSQQQAEGEATQGLPVIPGPPWVAMASFTWRKTMKNPWKTMVYMMKNMMRMLSDKANIKLSRHFGKLSAFQPILRRKRLDLMRANHPEGALAMCAPVLSRPQDEEQTGEQQGP